MKSNFIITTNKKSAEELIKNGLQVLSFGNNQWVFLNDEKNKINFSHLENIVFTNKLFI